MNMQEHEGRLHVLAARRRRAERARSQAQQALREGVREAVAAGMTQQAAASAAGITQGRVWQYLHGEQSHAESDPTARTNEQSVNARRFAAIADIDEYAFRRWLRSTGVRAGQGNEHQLPEPSSREGRRLLNRYKTSAAA